MKKFIAFISLATLVASAAPAFAAINPFMDVPMNHWAYDAIGQLAAHGILSGYPDGTYKGKQPTTRYEMASALARALAVIDMTKASKQDIETLKRLVVEFNDELEALGVRVDDLDERVSLIESRLGGWKLSGHMNFDINYRDDRPDGTAKSNSVLDEGRIYFERWFGDPDNPMYFHARLDSNPLKWSQFYVQIPFYFDSKLIVGRFNWSLESEYHICGATMARMPETGGYIGTGDVLSDRDIDAIGISKSFGLGEFRGYLSHQSLKDVIDTEYVTKHPDYSAWELFLKAKLQFTEQIGFDLGFQGFFGDNTEPDKPQVDDFSFKNFYTAFAGLRFNFMDSVGLKAAYYYQKHSVDQWNGANWFEPAQYDDDSNYWQIMLDVGQDALNFTSAWLEYGHVDAGFIMPSKTEAVFAEMGLMTKHPRVSDFVVGDDLNYWRIALGQSWTPKFGSHVYYYNYDFDNSSDAKEYGLGLQYRYNSNVVFGLNFTKVDFDDDNLKDDSMIKFRTDITF